MSIVLLDAIASEFHDKISKDASLAPVGENGSPLYLIGLVKIPVSIGTEQIFVVVNKFT